MMRIIAGRFKGRRLRTFAGAGIRPTSDRLRETLFNILQSDLEGARVWDAFAGTGAIGLEALSRGAAHVLFTEQDARAGRLVRENVEMLGVAEQTEIVVRDALAWSRTSDRRFDLIYLDPPYRFQQYDDLLEAIAAQPLCTPHGLVIVEHFKKLALWEGPAPRRRPDRQVRQGDSVLSFFMAKTLLHSSAAQ